MLIPTTGSSLLPGCLSKITFPDPPAPAAAPPTIVIVEVNLASTFPENVESSRTTGKSVSVKIDLAVSKDVFKKILVEPVSNETTSPLVSVTVPTDPAAFASKLDTINVAAAVSEIAALEPTTTAVLLVNGLG